MVRRDAAAGRAATFCNAPHERHRRSCQSLALSLIWRSMRLLGTSGRYACRALSLTMLPHVRVIAAGASALYRRAFDRTVGAIHAAIAQFGSKYNTAAPAFVKVDTRVSRHRLNGRRSAFRASEHRFKHHLGRHGWCLRSLGFCSLDRPLHTRFAPRRRSASATHDPAFSLRAHDNASC